jgi:hypothetical protein
MQKKFSILFVKINYLILEREIITVCSQICIKAYKYTVLTELNF